MNFPIPAAILALGASALVGCSTAPQSAERRDLLVQQGQTALAAMKIEDPSLGPVLESSYGYAVFPSVGKGGVGLGGAYGRGVVYEQGRLVGYSDLSQATIGFQLGGQEFSEVLVFEDARAMNRFKTGELEFSAQASAVALKAGAAGATNFKDGVAVFTGNTAGLMYEASIGGQKFNYLPASTFE
jgi:lipid-binding SYLF domain-containing protein